jgi:hypothetical protein
MTAMLNDPVRTDIELTRNNQRTPTFTESSTQIRGMGKQVCSADTGPLTANDQS